MHGAMKHTFAALGLTLSALLPATAQAQESDRKDCAEKVVLYEMLGCPHCANTRAFLDGNKIAYSRIDIWQNPDAVAYMLKYFGSPAVPVVTNGKKAVRGYTEKGLRNLLCLG
jgi:glutaredoxin